MPNKFSFFFRRGNKEEEDEARRQQEDEAKAKKALDRRAQITGEVVNDLWKAMKKGGQSLEKFVCRSDLDQIWDLSRIQQLAEGLDWCDPPSISQAKKDFLCVMSTLAWIRWDCWEGFGDLFLRHKDSNGHYNRTDDYLPLQRTSFLSVEQFKESFKEDQYIFKPVIILEDDPEIGSDYVEYSNKHRLPFVSTEYLAQGGTGIVTKEEIAPEYFGYRNGAYNKEPQFVARKCIPGAKTHGRWSNQSFTAEQKNLKAFKQCLEQNQNIMQSYTAFLHGSDFTIISPLADLDLLTYFTGKYPDFNSRSRGFTPAHLLYGAACLAGALRFLHEGLQPVGISEKIFCAHLDLKPENVLVIWPKGPNEPAGRWLVHDFGTSKIKEGRHSRYSTTLVAPGDFIRHFSLTKATRTPGPFQAPEVQGTTERVVGTESDMWSLGCILAVVLAFAVGGPPSVTELASSRSREEFEDDYFYIKDGNGFALKDPVSACLESLASGPGGDTWIRETLGLIYRTLVEDPRLRPSAKVVQDTLAAIYKRQDVSLSDPCSWIPRELPAPRPEPAPLAGRPESLEGPARLERLEGPARSERVGRVESPNPPRRRPDLPNVLIRPPTMPNPGIEEQPGLEVISPASPLSSAKSGSASQWQSDVESVRRDSRALSNGVSRSSSTSTRPVSLTEDVDFIRLPVPKHSFKSILCPQACHVAFLAKKQASIMRLLDSGWAHNHKCPILDAGYLQACTKDCPETFEWDDGCMSGSYMILRAKRAGSRDRKVYRYRYDESGRTWFEDPILNAGDVVSRALDIAISVYGDVVFICDDILLYYSNRYSFTVLPTRGRHRMASARFSPDGRWIFGWSHEPGLNHFYKWDTHQLHVSSNTGQVRTLKREWRISEKHNTPDRAGYGHPAVYPFLNYFVVFDRPDRVLTVGKDSSNPRVTQVPREVRDVIGGAGIQGVELELKVESLVLLQGNSNSQLVTFPMTHQGAGNPSEGSRLRIRFSIDEDALSVQSTETRFYIVVSHSDGRLERRRISST